MTAHTPGPWKAIKWASGNWHIISEYATRPLIVSTEFQRRHGINARQEKANARLIAAAPDLLAALEECRNHLASLHIHARVLEAADCAAIEARVRQADKVIAKATSAPEIKATLRSLAGPRRTP